MKKIILPLLLTILTPVLVQSQENKLRTIQAHIGGGLSTSITFSSSAGYLFDKHHGVRLSYFTQQRNNWSLMGGTSKVYDAFRTAAALYQFRVNAAENFDITAAAGPALLIPFFSDDFKTETGGMYHLSLNLWTNKQKPQWAGMGFWAGCGYMHSSSLDRFFAEAGIAVRFAY